MYHITITILNYLKFLFWILFWYNQLKFLYIQDVNMSNNIITNFFRVIRNFGKNQFIVGDKSYKVLDLLDQYFWRCLKFLEYGTIEKLEFAGSTKYLYQASEFILFYLNYIYFCRIHFKRSWYVCDYLASLSAMVIIQV